MKWKQIVAIIAGFIIGLMILYGFAELDLGQSRVVVDRTVSIGNNHTFNYDLDAGRYAIEVSSDEYVVIRFGGGGVDKAMNTSQSVKHYNRTVIVTDPSVMEIHNPPEILDNDTATVNLKILRE